jgi:cell division protein FtsI (penicillin-binding protein 3)
MAELRKDILWRMALLYILMIGFAVVIIGRILFIQVIEGKQWKSKANELTKKDIIIEPMRGEIYSGDGRVLASSVPFYEVRFDTKAEGVKKEYFKANVDSLSICLANLFGDKTAAEYKSMLKLAWQTGSRYELIKRKVNYSDLKKMKEFPIFRLGRNKGGFITIQTSRRAKPFGMLASRTIGYVTKERVVVGIEGAFDQYLRGKQGVELMQKLAGNIWMPVNNGNEVEPQDGYDVFSTIDINLQDVAQNALLKQLVANNAHHGCVVLMEVETGDIKAIANLEKSPDESEGYVENYNYAIGESSEPGSTFKLISMLAALEEGFIDLDDTINTGNGITTYYGSKMKDSHEGGYGKISAKDVFAVSSNVGVSKIISNYFSKEPHRFIDRIYKLKLNEKLGLDIKGEGTPYVKDPSDSTWSGISLPWISVGYEIRLTPLQILTVYNAVANNGRMVKPKLVKSLKFRGEIIKDYPAEIIVPSICSNETLKKLKIMLECVVENGTAKSLRSPLYKIAGKTGTAQVAKGKSGYKDLSYKASFVGYFPADNPKYSCIVVINDPDFKTTGAYYGGAVAGPVFKEISDKVYATSIDIHKPINISSILAGNFPLAKNGNKQDVENIYKTLGIAARTTAITSDWVMVTGNEKGIILKNTSIKPNQVPNVIGMGLRDALFLLENCGLQVKPIGKGTIKSQSIPAGTKSTNGQTIFIQLG